MGIEESRHPFIAFTDADCIVPKDWLERLSRGYRDLQLKDNKIVGVGGGNMPPSKSSRFHQSLGIYLDSFWGSLNSPQGRIFSHIKRVNSLSCTNVLYNKEILKGNGGFDPNTGNISEDFDINFRLRKNGYALYFIPALLVIHKLRPNLSSWLVNIALYGGGRAVVSFKHTLFLNPFFILSLLFIISMIFTPLGFLNPIFFLPLLYFPIISFYVLLMLLKKKKITLFGRTLIIFISTHFVYSFNLFYKSLLICIKK